MAKDTDVQVKDVALHYIFAHTRVPLKFGPEVTTYTTLARTCVTVEDGSGKTAQGWGETPLSVVWVWPSSLTYEERENVLKDFTERLAGAWKEYSKSGHPMEVGYGFQHEVLPKLHEEFNAQRQGEPMPWLGALVCCSPFDIALHDAYGVLHNVDIYETYNADFMSADLAHYITPAEDADVSFEGKYPQDFLVYPRAEKMFAWHLIGGTDPIEESELTGSEPDDAYPVLLRDWIRRDGLKCLKVKLRGNDPEWDYKHFVDVANISIEEGVDWLTSDFNCTVKDPAYVNEILDRLMIEHPRAYGMVLYVEQPFPYDLEENRIDVHSVSARKPLFMDESAHDWRLIGLGRSLGWTGVALKTCKTQTGALLSACWAKAHGMTLMVQDLSNPALAQIPHLLLASHVGTIMGVETNGMQFFPHASLQEEKVHPGIYRRRDGMVDLSTVQGPGFGYCLDKIERELPEAVVG